MGWLRRIKDSWNPSRETIDHPLFGRLDREGKGMWHGEVVLPQIASPPGPFSIAINSGEGRPTLEQEAWFGEIQERFDRLWPEIVDALARHHPDINTRELVGKHLDMAGFGLRPICDGKEPEWTFDCCFDSDPFMGYSAEFIGWKLVGIGGGD
jgi:hypothetical protein